MACTAGIDDVGRGDSNGVDACFTTPAAAKGVIAIGSLDQGDGRNIFNPTQTLDSCPYLKFLNEANALIFGHLGIIKCRCRPLARPM